MSELQLRLVIFASVVSGALIDFITNGVFKIVWAVIYIPIDVVAALSLAAWLARTKAKGSETQASIALLVGAAVCHIAMMGHHSEGVYAMMLDSREPLTFASSAWPQKLLVNSSTLTAAVAAHPQSRYDVATARVTDYGCTRSFTVVSVGGVNVQDDPEAQWSFKVPRGVVDPARDGPTNEDRVWPWCAISFYRH